MFRKLKRLWKRIPKDVKFKALVWVFKHLTKRENLVMFTHQGHFAIGEVVKNNTLTVHARVLGPGKNVGYIVKKHRLKDGVTAID